MFWIILLCHFIADYPLQTDGMVIAKKTLSGLIMHVCIHFIVMIALLCGILNLPVINGIGLAFAVTLFHFTIDFWKNVLFRLKPDWVIFSYMQDQVLHLLSILLVTLVWQYFSGENMFAIDKNGAVYIYAIGFLIISHVWFVTERILAYQHPNYQSWVITKLWPRMVFRVILYSSLIFGLGITGFLVIVGAFLVNWFDLEPEHRFRGLSIDCTGTILIMLLTGLILT